jgi:hypothetical protein
MRHLLIVTWAVALVALFAAHAPTFATTSCMKNEPAEPQVQPCTNCINYDVEGYQFSLECDSDPSPANQACTDPTAIDGILCDTPQAACGGKLWKYEGWGCSGWSADEGSCQRQYIAGTWWDAGNFPICP